jgi:hypothetical protein
MKKFFYLIFTTIILTSCEDLISIDISNQTPNLITPILNDTLQQSPVTIKWEEMKGATKYKLQIVSPSFDQIESFILDTIIQGSKFQIALDSNEYELKLIAYNSGYKSKELGPVKFWVGVSPTFTENKVTLLSPLDSIYVNAGFSPTFTWELFTDATSYEFSFRKGNNFSSGEILTTTNNIVTNIINLPNSINLSEGVYWWGIKAYSASSETIYSYRPFFVDITNPNTPILNAPSDLSNLNNTLITFIWNSGNDQGIIKAPIVSTIEIATDVFFTNVIQTGSYSNSTCQFNLSTGNYYWRVKNKDEANNSSSYSDTYSFNIN